MKTPIWILSLVIILSIIPFAFADIPFDKIAAQEIRIYVENVFNINYRNYLNRLRFFASEVGRISGFELNYTF